MILILSVRLLDDRFHGLASNGEQPNWPPSCFRMFQAIVAGNAKGESIPKNVIEALKWLESLSPPEIIIPPSQAGQVMLTYVLNNTEGRSRTQKFIRPSLLYGDRLIEFAWEYDPSDCCVGSHPQTLLEAVRHIRAFGWGIDLAIGHGVIVERLPEKPESRIHYFPSMDPYAVGIDIRVPRVGSLESLQDCYRQYLGRFHSNESTILESGGPLYKLWPYTVGTPRSCSVFKLLDADDDTYSYSQAKLIHISGMVRHLAIERMKLNPPRDLRDYSPESWLRSYVAGHQSNEDKATNKLHSHFSFVPLPSIGNEHTDPSIRRVMVIAPLGDDAWLEHLSQQIDGELLQPLSHTVLPPGTHLELVRAGTKDGVRARYTCAANSWASFTPVILPGHDDHKPDKTRKLIEKALVQSDIEQPCTFEWSTFSHFQKSFSAHKYDKDKRLTGYVRPDHLLNQTAVHLKLKFADDVKVPGPLTLGAGRHCGFGLMVGIDSTSENY